MAQSRLTINVNCSYVKDWNATLRFLRALDPVTVIAVIDNMANKGRILEIKAALPHAKIIARCIIVVEEGKQLDGAMHLKPQDSNYWLVSPGAFLDKYGELGQSGLSLSYFNEPQTSNATDENIRRQVQHMIETLGLAIQRGISLVVGNWGVGQAPDWAGGRFDDVLTLISRHPELFAVGLHLYAPVDTFNELDGLIARSKAIPIPKVPVIVSEFGFDTDGNANGLNGYRSRGYSGVQFGGWCVDKLKNVYSPYIQAGTLDSVAVFGWGYAASFANFDVETDTDWQATILDAANKGLLSVTTTPPTATPTPKPAINVPLDLGIPKTVIIQGSASWNLRTDADPAAPSVGLVNVGESITIYPATITSRVNNWYYVVRASAPAGESATGWIAYVLPVTAPLPTPPVVGGVGTPTPPLPAPFLEVSSQRAKELANTYRQLSASYLQSSVAHKQQAESEALLSQDMLTLAQTWDDIALQTTVNKAA